MAKKCKLLHTLQKTSKPGMQNIALGRLMQALVSRLQHNEPGELRLQ